MFLENHELVFGKSRPGSIWRPSESGGSFTTVKMQKIVQNWLKWVQKNDLGVSRGQERSKLRFGSIGRPPGGQKPLKKFKKGQKPRKSGKSRIFRIFPISRCGPYRAYFHCLGLPAGVTSPSVVCYAVRLAAVSERTHWPAWEYIGN